MSKACEVCGKGVTFGNHYARRGLARAKGGAGRKVTGKSPRRFTPNIQRIRAVTKTGGVKRMRVCTECIKRGRVAKAPNIPRRAAPAE
jgi:large subunit ribosomal protein L28